MIADPGLQPSNSVNIPSYQLSFLDYCPSCGMHSRFVYCGTQQFPRRVAALAGLPSEVHLYNCTHCGSTISHVNLKS